jgi:hypothetical protein
LQEVFGGEGNTSVDYSNPANKNIIFYNRQAKPFGITWEEWTARWWQWILSIPKDENPGNDKTGKNFRDQDNSHVLFLAGTHRLSGPAERTVTMSANKPVLFPVINFTTSFVENPNLKTEFDLISHARASVDDIAKKEASIDGKKVQNLDKYRVQSPIFSVTFPENNVYGVRAGPTKGVSDGYWIFLEHIMPGNHKIHTFGSCLAGTVNIEVTYHLRVK